MTISRSRPSTGRMRRYGIARPMIFVLLGGLLCIGSAFYSQYQSAREQEWRERRRRARAALRPQPFINEQPVRDINGSLFEPPSRMTTFDAPNAITSAEFSPDGQFLAATTDRIFSLWPVSKEKLSSHQLSTRPVFRAPSGSSRIHWTSSRTGLMAPRLGFKFDEAKHQWSTTKETDSKIPGFNANGSPFGNGSADQELFVPASHAVVSTLFETSSTSAQNELKTNLRIEISSFPDGKNIKLPAGMELSNGAQTVFLAPREADGRLVGATYNWIAATGWGRLRVYDVTGGRMLWEKKFSDWGGKLLFTPDGRYLIGGGLPRLEGSNINGRDLKDAIYIWDAKTGRLLKRLNEPYIDPRSLRFNSAKNCVIYFKRASPEYSDLRMVARSVPDGNQVLRSYHRPKTPRLNEPPQIRVSPDGNMIALASREGLQLVTWDDLVTGQYKKKILDLESS